MTRRTHRDRIPLLPLADTVHFPRTRIGLTFDAGRHRDLLAALAERNRSDRWLGVVLADPDAPPRPDGRRGIFPSGTAGRVTALEQLDDGGSRLALDGESRFTVTSELIAGPYREAWIERLAEPVLDESDAGLHVVRRSLIATLLTLHDRNGLGPEFDLGGGDLLALAAGTSFEALVNRITAEVDLPPTRKLSLLVESLPDRALALLTILRQRLEVVEFLAPFRRLAAHPERN